MERTNERREEAERECPREIPRVDLNSTLSSVVLLSLVVAIGQRSLICEMVPVPPGESTTRERRERPRQTSIFPHYLTCSHLPPLQCGDGTRASNIEGENSENIEVGTCEQ